MGLPKLKPHYITEQEYLDREKCSDIKHEYFDGEIFAVASAKINHQRLISTLTSKIYAHLDGTPCEVFSSDIKVRADKGDKYFYPDILVSCDNEDGESQFTELTLPVLEIYKRVDNEEMREFLNVEPQKI